MGKEEQETTLEELLEQMRENEKWVLHTSHHYSEDEVRIKAWKEAKKLRKIVVDTLEKRINEAHLLIKNILELNDNDRVRNEGIYTLSILLVWERYMDNDIFWLLANDLILHGCENEIVEEAAKIHHAEPDVPLIMKYAESTLLKSTDWQFRSQIAKVIGRIGGEKELSLLKEVLVTSEHELEKEALKIAIQKIKDKPVKQWADILLREAPEDVTYEEYREYAAEQLGKSGREEAVEPLLEALEEERDEDVKLKILEALDILGSKKEIDKRFQILINLLNECYDEYGMEDVVQALGRLGDKRGLEPLKKLLNSEYYTSIKNYIEDAIKKLENS